MHIFGQKFISKSLAVSTLDYQMASQSQAIQGGQKDQGKRVIWYYFCGRFPYWPGGFIVCGFYVQEHPKAQPAVVLVLNCLRRQGHGLKSPQADWEKLGIEPTTLGLRDIHLFVAFLGINQFRRVGLTYVLVLRWEHLEMKVTTLASYRLAICFIMEC